MRKRRFRHELRVRHEEAGEQGMQALPVRGEQELVAAQNESQREAEKPRHGVRRYDDRSAEQQQLLHAPLRLEERRRSGHKNDKEHELGQSTARTSIHVEVANADVMSTLCESGTRTMESTSSRRPRARGPARPARGVRGPHARRRALRYIHRAARAARAFQAVALRPARRR